MADTVRVAANIDLVEAAERLAHPEELLAAEQRQEAGNGILNNGPVNSHEQNASISTSDPSMETAKASSVAMQKKDRMKVAIGRGLQAMGGHTDASMMARGVGAGAFHLAGSMVGLGNKTQGMVDQNREAIRQMQQSRMPSLEDALDALGADTRSLGIQR